MNVSDTCNAAADLIEVRGWTHGPTGWGDPEEDGEGVPLCLEGAIAAAAGITENIHAEVDGCPAYAAVCDYLGGKPPWIWNDDLLYVGNPFDHESDEAHDWARKQVIATLRAVAVIHAAREDESVETRTVEAVSA